MDTQVRLPDVPDDVNDMVNGLLKQLAAKRRRNRLRTAYYESRKFATHVGTTIPAHYARLGMVLGWPAKAVDLLARRCNLDGFVWADGDLDALGIKKLVDQNFLLSEVAQARTDSLLHGVSFLITTRGGPGEPDALVTAKDALSATGEWNPRRRGLDSFLSVTGTDADGRVNGLALYLDGVTWIADRDSSGWQVERQTHGFGVPVDALRYRPRTSRPMGASRVTRPVMSITDQALRALVRLEAHMDIYAIAKLVLLGADESIFRDENGQPKDEWRLVMGRVFGIPDDDEAVEPRADVKQLTAESPEPHLANLNALAKLFAREASLPDTAVAITDVANPTSAESFDASQYELIAEAEGATDDWSVPVRRATVRALAIQNGMSEVPDEWLTIGAKWRDPRYLSRAAEADAGAKILSAAPQLANTAVGLGLLGLTAQQVDLAMAEIRRTRSVDLVERLTSAAQQARRDPQVADLADRRGDN